MITECWNLTGLSGSGCTVQSWGKYSVQWKIFWFFFLFLNCRSWLVLLSDVASGLDLKDKEVKWVSLFSSHPLEECGVENGAPPSEFL